MASKQAARVESEPVYPSIPKAEAKGAGAIGKAGTKETKPVIEPLPVYPEAISCGAWNSNRWQ